MRASRATKSPGRTVAGIDGCRGGWCVALGRSESGLLSVECKVLPTFEQAVAATKDATDIGVDIPIGLVEQGRRECDLLARQALGSRWMTVFPAPPRPILAASSYAEASSMHRKLCEGLGLSRQAWGIAPKIAEVDAFLRARPGYRERIWEVHPELCFASLNRGTPLLVRKATREGLAARRALLAGYVSKLDRAVRAALEAWPRKHLGEDDVLDAVVACVTAVTWRPESTIMASGAERDAYGLPIQMRRPAFDL